jgi:hypothetical protein
VTITCIEPTLTPPYSRGGSQMLFADANRYRELEGYDNLKLVLTTTKKSRHIEKRATMSKSLDYILKLAKEKTNYYLPFPPFSLSEMRI